MSTTITFSANQTNYNKTLALTFTKTTGSDLNNNPIIYYKFNNTTDSEIIDYTVAPIYNSLAIQYIANTVIGNLTNQITSLTNQIGVLNTTVTNLNSVVKSLTPVTNPLLSLLK